MCLIGFNCQASKGAGHSEGRSGKHKLLSAGSTGKRVFAFANTESVAQMIACKCEVNPPSASFYPLRHVAAMSKRESVTKGV